MKRLYYPELVKVGGHDITDKVVSMIFKARVGEIPSATIEVLDASFVFDGQARLEVNTRDGIEDAILNRMIARKLLKRGAKYSGDRAS